jgi:hypothetical protein
MRGYLKRKDVLRMNQKSLINSLVRYKGRIGVKGVYYNTDVRFADNAKELCGYHTLVWIEKIARMGDMPLQPNDSRLEDCVLLRNDSSTWAVVMFLGQRQTFI